MAGMCCYRHRHPRAADAATGMDRCIYRLSHNSLSTPPRQVYPAGRMMVVIDILGVAVAGLVLLTWQAAKKADRQSHHRGAGRMQALSDAPGWRR